MRTVIYVERYESLVITFDDSRSGEAGIRAVISLNVSGDNDILNH
jgi:hypothetical protein